MRSWSLPPAFPAPPLKPTIACHTAPAIPKAVAPAGIGSHLGRPACGWKSSRQAALSRQTRENEQDDRGEKSHGVTCAQA